MHQIKRIALILKGKHISNLFIMEFAAQILILIYILLTFTYSAFEKIFQWKGSIVYYKSHFQDTFMENFIPPSLILVVLLEIVTAVLLILGIYDLILLNQKQFGFYGLLLAAITLIGLMTGQRIAKDYNGAMLITVYFILTVFGVFLMQ
jgi:uncharacterized membrane protein YphA (DoxX/SURF4 family)